MATINSYTSLSVTGSTVDTDVISLYAQGGYGLTINDNAPLATWGHYDLNAVAPLSLTGMVEVTESETLYINGIGVTNRVGYLYLTGFKNELNAYAPLFVQVGTGTFGMQESMTLYMPAPEVVRGAPLFLKNTQSSAPHSEGRPLIIGGGSTPSTDTLDLYLQNDSTGGAMTLWIKTPGMWEGWQPFGQGAPLFINRPDESIAMTLFCKALDNGVNSYAPLHIYSAIADNDAITLAVPNVASEELNTYATLAIAGVVISSDSETLFTTAHGLLNGTAPLVVYQETGTPNAYVYLSTTGAYLLNDAITLVIPSVTDPSPTNNLPLYVLGWTL